MPPRKGKKRKEAPQSQPASPPPSQQQQPAPASQQSQQGGSNDGRNTRNRNHNNDDKNDDNNDNINNNNNNNDLIPQVSESQKQVLKGDEEKEEENKQQSLQEEAENLQKSIEYMDKQVKEQQLKAQQNKDKLQQQLNKIKSKLAKENTVDLTQNSGFREVAHSTSTGPHPQLLQPIDDPYTKVKDPWYHPHNTLGALKLPEEKVLLKNNFLVARKAVDHYIYTNHMNNTPVFSDIYLACINAPREERTNKQKEVSELSSSQHKIIVSPYDSSFKPQITNQVPNNIPKPSAQLVTNNNNLQQNQQQLQNNNPQQPTTAEQAKEIQRRNNILSIEPTNLGHRFRVPVTNSGNQINNTNGNDEMGESTSSSGQPSSSPEVGNEYEDEELGNKEVQEVAKSMGLTIEAIAHSTAAHYRIIPNKAAQPPSLTPTSSTSTTTNPSVFVALTKRDQPTYKPSLTTPDQYLQTLSLYFATSGVTNGEQMAGILINGISGSSTSQAQLLRILQENKVKRLPGDEIYRKVMLAFKLQNRSTGVSRSMHMNKFNQLKMGTLESVEDFGQRFEKAMSLCDKSFDDDERAKCDTFVEMLPDYLKSDYLLISQMHEADNWNILIESLRSLRDLAKTKREFHENVKKEYERQKNSKEHESQTYTHSEISKEGKLHDKIFSTPKISREDYRISISFLTHHMGMALTSNKHVADALKQIKRKRVDEDKSDSSSSSESSSSESDSDDEKDKKSNKNKNHKKKAKTSSNKSASSKPKVDMGNYRGPVENYDPNYHKNKSRGGATRGASRSARGGRSESNPRGRPAAATNGNGRPIKWLPREEYLATLTCEHCGLKGHNTNYCGKLQQEKNKKINNIETKKEDEEEEEPNKGTKRCSNIDLVKPTSTVPTINIYIGEALINDCLPDTGSEVTLIHKKVYESLVPLPVLSAAKHDLQGANGNKINVLGVFSSRISFVNSAKGESYTRECPIYVAETLNHHCIIGKNDLMQVAEKISLKDNSLEYKEDLVADITYIKRQIKNTNNNLPTGIVKPIKHVNIPAYSSREVECIVSDFNGNRISREIFKQDTTGPLLNTIIKPIITREGSTIIPRRTFQPMIKPLGQKDSWVHGNTVRILVCNNTNKVSNINRINAIGIIEHVYLLPRCEEELDEDYKTHTLSYPEMMVVPKFDDNVRDCGVKLTLEKATEKLLETLKPTTKIMEYGLSNINNIKQMKLNKKKQDRISKILYPRVKGSYKTINNIKGSVNKSITKTQQEEIDKIVFGEHLTPSQLLVAKKLVEEYADIVDSNENEITSARTDTEHVIKIPNDVPPVKQKNFPVRGEKRDAIDKDTEGLLKAGRIEPSNSPWRSPVLAVPKKDGGYRICVDLRVVNKFTEDDSYCIPMTSERMCVPSSCKWLSSIDIRTAFHTVPLEEKSRKYTAFAAADGLYQYTVMPFGAKTAPATWHRHMDNIFRDFSDFTTVYFDDVIIHTNESFEDHVFALRKVFDLLRKHNLHIKASKAQLFMKEVHFVGHIIGNGKIRPDPARGEAISKFPRPTDITSLRSFLGMVNYYRAHYKDLAIKAAPLYKLTHKDAIFNWTDVEEKAFEEIKKDILKAPCLKAPDFNRPFILVTDASNVGIGGVLEQPYPEGNAPVAFFSRQLIEAEKNYSTTELEALAIVWGITKYKAFLENKPFTVVTDHKPLTWWPNTKSKSSRLRRQADLLSQYQFDVVYRKGEENVVADGLSRAPLPAKAEDTVMETAAPMLMEFPESLPIEEFNASKHKIKIKPIKRLQNIEVNAINKKKRKLPTKKNKSIHKATQEEIAMDNSLVSDWNLHSNIDAHREDELYHEFMLVDPTTDQEFAQEQAKDESIRDIVNYIKRKELPNNFTPLQKSQLIRDSQHYYLDPTNNLLYYMVITGQRQDPYFHYRRLVVPHKYRSEILYMYHGSSLSGHSSAIYTFNKLIQRYTWPGMYQDVIEYINGCESCKQIKINRKKLQTELKQLQTATMPFQYISADITEIPGNTNPDYKYILTVIDHCTRWIITIPVVNKDARNIAKLLIDFVFTKYGFPEYFLTDQGTEFANQLLTQICRITGINKKFSTAFRPQANSIVERCHGIIKQGIMLLCSKEPNNWPEYLQIVTYSVNCTIHNALGVTPFFALFGRQPNIFGSYGKLDENEQLIINPNVDQPIVPEDYLLVILHNMEVAMQIANNIRIRKQDTIDDFNATIRSFAVFNPNDEVYVLHHSRAKSGQIKTNRWKPYDGPYTVIKRINPAIYKIQKSGSPQAKIETVHVDRLKKGAERNQTYINPNQVQQGETTEQNLNSQYAQTRIHKNNNNQNQQDESKMVDIPELEEQDLQNNNTDSYNMLQPILPAKINKQNPNGENKEQQNYTLDDLTNSTAVHISNPNNFVRRSERNMNPSGLRINYSPLSMSQAAIDYKTGYSLPRRSLNINITK